MSLTVFLALCILGLDFMLYMLFQWTYGDKRRAIARKVDAHRKAFEDQSPRPFLVHSQKIPPGRQELRRSVGERPPKSKPRGLGPTGAYDERVARP